MRGRPEQLISFFLLLFLAGCVREGVTRPDALPVRQYVEVPEELTKRCDWPKDWPKRRVLESNAIRGQCLKQYEGQFEGIEKLRQ